MLKYGDISVSDDGGSWITGQYYNRICLLSSNADEKYWFKFLYSKEGKPNENSVEIIRNYLQQAEATESTNEIRQLLITGLEYMEQKKYLYNKELKRYFLLNGHQARENKYVEPIVYYLHTKIERSFIWSHNYCALNFASIDGCVVRGKSDDAYYLDIILDRNNLRWICKFSHRRNLILSDGIVQLLLSLSWKSVLDAKDKKQYMKIDIPVLNQFDTMDAITEVKDWFDKLWLEIERRPNLWI